MEVVSQVIRNGCLVSLGLFDKPSQEFVEIERDDEVGETGYRIRVRRAWDADMLFRPLTEDDRWYYAGFLPGHLRALLMAPVVPQAPEADSEKTVQGGRRMADWVFNWLVKVIVAVVDVMRGRSRGVD